jgi:hypothetical protein
MCRNTAKQKTTYQKGQKILFKGEEAIILEVEPVFTVQVIGDSHIACGHIIDDMSPYESKD